MTFGEKITALRKEKGWTQTELAEKLKSHKTLIGKYERDESKPSIDLAKKIANIFSISIDYLADNQSSITVIHDKGLMHRMSELEKLSKEDLEKVYFFLDAVIRDSKTRKAYAN